LARFSNRDEAPNQTEASRKLWQGVFLQGVCSILKFKTHDKPNHALNPTRYSGVDSHTRRVGGRRVSPAIGGNN